MNNQESTIESDKKTIQDLEAALGTAKKTEEQLKWIIASKTRRLEQKDSTINQLAEESRDTLTHPWWDIIRWMLGGKQNDKNLHEMKEHLQLKNLKTKARDQIKEKDEDDLQRQFRDLRKDELLDNILDEYEALLEERLLQKVLKGLKELRQGQQDSGC